MRKMSVKYNGKEYNGIKKGDGLTLDLSEKEIKQITDIEGLETLTNLQILNLSNNQISEITGLENLSELRELDLSFNKITDIQGLKNLVNLRELNLKGNRFVTIKGFENLINLEKLNLGLGYWDVDNVREKPLEGWGMPKHTLILNGKELTGIEKFVVKGGAKNIVAYCRLRLKQAGYVGALVPADSKIESLEKKIQKEIQKYDKKIKKAMRKKREFTKQRY
jgi:Leucine-rich repeat (LRR) protein